MDADSWGLNAEANYMAQALNGTYVAKSVRYPGESFSNGAQRLS